MHLGSWIGMLLLYIAAGLLSLVFRLRWWFGFFSEGVLGVLTLLGGDDARVGLDAFPGEQPFLVEVPVPVIAGDIEDTVTEPTT